MGMDTRVQFCRELAAKQQDLLEVKKMCDEKGISYPKEVKDLLDLEDEIVHDKYIPIGYHANEAMLKECCSEICSDGRQGYDVFLNKLPKDITVIRFYNSW